MPAPSGSPEGSVLMGYSPGSQSKNLYNSFFRVNNAAVIKKGFLAVWNHGIFVDYFSAGLHQIAGIKG